MPLSLGEPSADKGDAWESCASSQLIKRQLFGMIKELLLKEQGKVLLAN